MAERESLFKRLTRIMKGGVVVRSKIKTANITDRPATSMLDHFNSQNYLYSNTVASYGQYDRLCIALHTKIPVPGPERYATLKELIERYPNGEKFLIYTYDHEQKKIVPAWAHHPRSSGYKDTVKVVFDDNSELICTPDHKCMLRDGTYKEAQDLKPNDSMMPLYRRYFNGKSKNDGKDFEGYASIYTMAHDSYRGWEPEHKLIIEWCKERKVIRNEEHVHHIDHNVQNNNPENLVIMNAHKHLAMHGVSAKEQWADPEKRARLQSAIQQAWDNDDGSRRAKVANVNRRADVREKRQAHALKNNPAKRADVKAKISKSQKDFYKSEENRKKHSECIALAHKEGRLSTSDEFIYYWKNRKRTQEFKDARKGENNPVYRNDLTIDKIIDAAIKCNFHNASTCKAVGATNKVLGRHIKNNGFKNWKDFCEQTQKENHKIISIELWEKIEVGDLTVDGYENFATDTILVHNSRYADFSEMEYCLSGDTRVAIPNGYKTLEELAKLCEADPDYEFVVYAYDHNKQQIVPAIAKQARCTQITDSFKITFDSGKELIGTANHRLLKRDGTFCRIDELKPGDSMMPFYRKEFFGTGKDEGDSYRWIYTMDYENSTRMNGWVSEHRLVAAWAVGGHSYKENEVVHHKNFIKYDNRPENLLIMNEHDHYSYHAKIINEKKWSDDNKEWIEKFKKNHSKYMKENNPAERKDITFGKILQLCEIHDFNLYKLCEIFDTDPNVIKRKLRDKGYANFEIFAKAYQPEWKNHGHDNAGTNNPRYDHNLTYQNICDAYTDGMSLKVLSEKLNTTGIKILNRMKSEGYSGYRDWKNNYENHKVVSIEYYDVIPLYDLTVDGYKNFATDSVISHNTPEISSALDIYCLAGDNIIPLLDGTTKTIQELFDEGIENFEVYSYDIENNKFVQGICKRALKTGVDQQIYKVTFDDGTFLRLTENHLVLLSSGEYKRVKELNLSSDEAYRSLTLCGYKNWHEFVEGTNHKVVSIEPDGIEDVYDLCVDKWHNFAVGSSNDNFVIVHNSDEVCASDERGGVLHIHSDNQKIKELLENLFFEVLNVEFNLGVWVRNLVKYGDFFLFNNIHTHYGVVNVFAIPVNEIEREEGYDPEDPFAVRFRWVTQGNQILENWMVTHFRLTGNDNFLPYGSSVIESARRIWRQLILIEDAMMVYRIIRSPERRVFYIDVANVPPDDIPTYLEKIRNELRSNKIIDKNSGRVDMRYNALSVDEDYFIPMRGESGSRIETLAGGQFTGDIEDVEYIQKKLFAALKIPRAYLGYDEDLCLSEHTVIPLTNGKHLTIKEISDIFKNNLYEEYKHQFEVYSWSDDKKKIIAQPIKWCGPTKVVNSLIKVTLDNGETIECTHNHPFLLRDGTYKRADELLIGTSLMSLYRKISSREKNNNYLTGYEMIFNPIKKRWDYTHRIFGKQKYSNLNKTNVIHHADCDKRNNNTSNLLLIKNGQLHREIHAALNKIYKKHDGKNNPNYNHEANIKILIASASNCASFIELEEKSGYKSRVIKRLLKDKLNMTYRQFAETYMPLAKKNGLYRCGGYKLNYNDVIRAVDKLRRVYSIKDINRTKICKELNVSSAVIQHILRSNNFENWHDFKERKLRNLTRDELLNAFMQHGTANKVYENEYIDKCSQSKFNSAVNELFGGKRAAKKFAEEEQIVNNNHKVIAVEEFILNSPVIVYDLQVDTQNDTERNFAISFNNLDGIFVHNSGKATLAQEDVRFSRTVTKIQRSIISELSKLAIIHLISHGFTSEDLVDFTLSLSNPSTVAQQQKLELWRTRFEIAQSIPDGHMSRQWVQNEIYTLTKDEREKIKKQKLEDVEEDLAIQHATEAEIGGMPAGGEAGPGGAGETLSGIMGGEEVPGVPKESPAPAGPPPGPPLKAGAELEFDIIAPRLNEPAGLDEIDHRFIETSEGASEENDDEKYSDISLKRKTKRNRRRKRGHVDVDGGYPLDALNDPPDLNYHVSGGESLDDPYDSKFLKSFTKLSLSEGFSIQNEKQKASLKSIIEDDDDTYADFISHELVNFDLSGIGRFINENKFITREGKLPGITTLEKIGVTKIRKKNK